MGKFCKMGNKQTWNIKRQYKVTVKEKSKEFRNGILLS